MNTAILVALSALVLGLSVLLLFVGIFPAARAEGRPPGPLTRIIGKLQARLSKRDRIVIAVGLAGGVILYSVTGLLIALVAVPAAAIGLPILLSKPPTAKKIERLEAIESWTRALGGLIGSGVGIEGAIVVSVSNAPESIKPEVRRLVARINARWSITDALASWADEMDDATADVVAAHLIQSTKQRGAGLATALQDLSNTVTSEVRHRLEIESDQEKPRATARNVTLVTVVALGLLALTGSFLNAYQSAVGQLLLSLYIVAYVLMLMWMRKMSNGKPIPRFLVETRTGESHVA